MEILIGVVISSLTQILKWGVKKLGVETTKQITAGVVFILCGIGAYLYSTGILTLEFINNLVQIFLVSVGYYEVVYKKILEPTFNNLIKK